jgi:transcriptional regulator of acetoin/glycerol metabolism
MHSWPLNIRELERSLAAALAVAKDRIELPHLPVSVRTPTPAPAAPTITALPENDEGLRDLLVSCIARHDGNLAGVARELGKDRTQIRRWMKKFGLSRADDPDDSAP